VLSRFRFETALAKWMPDRIVKEDDGVICLMWNGAACAAAPLFF